MNLRPINFLYRAYLFLLTCCKFKHSRLETIFFFEHLDKTFTRGDRIF